MTDGNGGNNYQVTFVNNTTGVITARAITVTAATDTKGYDGLKSSSALPTVTAGSLAPGDVANFTETFDTKNVGSGKTLTPAGSVIDGNGGNNYQMTFANDTTRSDHGADDHGHCRLWTGQGLRGGRPCPDLPGHRRLTGAR